MGSTAAQRLVGLEPRRLRYRTVARDIAGAQATCRSESLCLLKAAVHREIDADMVERDVPLHGNSEDDGQ
jgi:hypothetical protein